jgi:glycosyltransferase involved in cell wall biosynthesis
LVEVGLRWPPEPFLLQKIQCLAARGFRVSVVSVTSREQAKTTHIPGVELHRLPEPGERRLRVVARAAWNALLLLLTRPGRIPALINALRSSVPPLPTPAVREAVARLPAFLSLARLRPDIVQFEWPWRARFYRPVVDVWACPYVISLRSGHYEAPTHTAAARSVPALFAEAAAVHCVSDAIAHAAIKWYELEPNKSWTIRPGIDPSFFRPAGRNGNAPTPFRVVSVARLVWEKGHEYALAAIRRLVDGGIPVRFDIVGDGIERDRVLHTIADLGLEERVHLHGELSLERVRDRLREGDVLLHASIVEGLPNAVLEAMACELPVVATDCGGVREAVNDGVEGFVVRRRAVRDLADRLATLWRDPALRAAMGRAGRARIEAEFTFDRQAQGFVELYEHVAGARPVAARGRRR